MHPLQLFITSTRLPFPGSSASIFIMAEVRTYFIAGVTPQAGMACALSRFLFICV
jgi:hypothetical protein